MGSSRPRHRAVQGSNPMRDIFYNLAFIATRINSGHCCKLSNKELG